MAVGRLVTAALVVTLTGMNASGQTTGDRLSPVQVGVACAPPPVLARDRPDAIRVLGPQDVEARDLLHEQDRLVINAGAVRNITVGQEYFLRSVVNNPEMSGKLPQLLHTSGWVKIVAVNDTTSIASVERACGPISTGDFIEPFVAPVVPENADRVDATGRLDFTAMGRVLFGTDAHSNSTVGDFVIIDQGADHGFVSGASIAIFRDPDGNGLPLVAVGEAKIMVVGPTLSVVRINQAKGELRTGDYVVPRR